MVVLPNTDTVLVQVLVQPFFVIVIVNVYEPAEHELRTLTEDAVVEPTMLALPPLTDHAYVSIPAGAVNVLVVVPSTVELPDMLHAGLVRGAEVTELLAALVQPSTV